MNAVPAAALNSAEHPSPHRDKVNVWWLLAGLAAGPAAWILQLVIDYGLASHACFPRETPYLGGLPAPGAGEPVWLVGVNLACLCLAVGGTLVSHRNWRRTRAEKHGGAAAVLDVGEGRTRFLATCGILAGAAFALAILFDTAEPLVVAACWRLVP